MCARSSNSIPRPCPAGTRSTGCATRWACGSRPCREFREKLADSRFNLDHPVWVEDKDFDVDRHLHRIGLPSPGGRNELAEICGHIASLSLDRSRPLWEMWVIENVAGTDAHEGGRLAVMTKVHHAGVDGVTGANLMSQLCSTEPDAPPPDPVDGVGDATGLEIAVSGAIKFATRPLEAGQRAADDGVDGGRHRQARPQRPDAWPRRSPRRRPRSTPTSPATATSRIAQLDLEDIKTVKNHFGVKVNDVVMALVSGVLRKFLHDRGELPDNTLVAMVPVSVHDKSDRPGRNQVSGMFSRLETNIEDPAERLKVHRRSEFRCQTT